MMRRWIALGLLTLTLVAVPRAVHAVGKTAAPADTSLESLIGPPSSRFT